MMSASLMSAVTGCKSGALRNSSRMRANVQPSMKVILMPTWPAPVTTRRRNPRNEVRGGKRYAPERTWRPKSRGLASNRSDQVSPIISRSTNRAAIPPKVSPGAMTHTSSPKSSGRLTAQA